MADVNRICSVEGCNRKVKYRGLCGMHVQRLERLGDPLAEPKRKSPPPVPERLCSVDGCGKLHKAHGYCPKHLNRFKNHGNALHISNTERGVPLQWIHNIPESDDCVLWPFGVDTGGYGQLRIGGKTFLAHRYAKMLQLCPLDRSLLCLHTCDTPRCCNPNHLYWGTTQQNADDMVNRGRNYRGEDHQWSHLTEREVREIFRLRETTSMTQQQIADRFEIDDSTVGAILSGRSWRFVYNEVKPTPKRLHSTMKLTPEFANEILAMREDESLTVAKICELLDIGKTTFYRAVHGKIALKRTPTTKTEPASRPATPLD